MRKEGLRGGPLAQTARWRGHHPGRAREAPGQGVAPLGAPFGLLDSSILIIFLVIFLEFSGNIDFSPFW